MLNQQSYKEAKQWWFYAAIIAIICVSYSFYASTRYPLLSSDDGLNILMAHYYDLPGDIYCWGQDRLGSIIPLFAQFFMKVFGTTAITGVSLSNYLILTAGFIGFSSLLKTRFSKLILALIWFLPYQRFIDINRFTIGVEYSLIGFSIFLMLKLRFEGKSFFNFRNHFLLATITLLLGLAIWASDLAAVSIFILFFTLWLFHYRTKKTFLFRKEVALYLLGGMVFWTLFIIKAKSYAVVKTEQFASLNSFGEIFDGIGIMLRSIKDVLLFKEQDYFTSIYAWLVPVLLVWVIIHVWKRRLKLTPGSRKWAAFLLLDLLGILGVILLSHWVLINEMGRRYFVATYISMAVLVLLVIEHLLLSAKQRKLLHGLLIVVVVTGAASPIYNMKYVTAKTLRPTADLAGEFKQLGKIGIIAEYWNAYRSSCAHLDWIKATPHDKSDVRNPKLVAEVFAQPNLYVIRDLWMDSFPDTLKQFGFTLVKDGNEFYMGGCFTCKYRRLSLSHVYTVGELKTNPAFVTGEGTNKTITVTPSSPGALNLHMVYGPNISLLPGKYKVRYHLKATGITTDKVIGTIDISGESAQQQLLLKDLDRTLFPTDDFRYIDAELTVPSRMSNCEFRLIYSGNASISLDRIELIEY